MAKQPPPPAPGPTDTVPAMLTPGEYVLKRDAVRRIGVQTLNRLNQGTRGYEEGGSVTPAVRESLAQAGQYSGSSTILTPENARDFGLDPERGYLAKTPPNTGGPVGKVFAPDAAAVPVEKPGAKVFAPDAPEVPAEKAKGDGQPKVFAPNAPEAKVNQQPQQPQQQQPTPPVSMASRELPQPPSQPSQQPQQKPPTTYPTIAEDQPDTEEQLRALINQGHSPGAAQAIVAGQEPKTLSGNAPVPKTVQPKQPSTDEPIQPADAKATATLEDQIRANPNAYTVDRDGTVFDRNTGRAIGTTDATEEMQKLTNPDPNRKLPTIIKGTAKAPPPKIQLASPSSDDQTPTTINGNRLYGTATSFGLNYDGSVDTDDNGRGFFGGVNTRNPNLKAVAVPVDVLEKTFGHFAQLNSKGGYDALDTPEAKAIIRQIQSAHVELPDPNGKIHKFPIVDIQGSLARHAGKVLDLTYGAAKAMGFTDNHAVSYQIIGGDGKPYPIPDIELAGTGGRHKGGGKGEDTLVPMVPSETNAPAPAQAEVPLSTSGGRTHLGATPEEAARSPGGWFGGIGFPYGGRTQQPKVPQAEEEEEQQPPLIAALMVRGFSQPQAIAYAKGLQNVLPGATQTAQLPAPAAPTAQPQLTARPQPLALPAPAAPSPSAQIAELSLLQKQPAIAPARKVPPIVPGKKPMTPGAPAAPGVSATDKNAVVNSLVGMGIQKPHAQQLVAGVQGNTVSELLQNALKAHGQGAIRGVTSGTFRPPPAAPTSKQVAPLPARQPVKQPVTPAPTEQYARPAGSTHGQANPPAFEALSPETKLPEAVKEHARLVSEDDPRVKKTKDGTIKGEHFVEGDPIHERLLEGLPEGKHGPQRQMLAKAEEAIAEKRPMHISYLSAPKEAQRYPTRESRTVQYEEHTPEARLMGSTVGQLAGHSFIPTAVGIRLSRTAGEPHQSYIQGISTNILANNFRHLNEKLAAMGLKTPYEKLGNKFYNDLEGYYSNLNAGHTATGRGHALGTEELPNVPDPSHIPYKLKRREADFINTVINNTAAFAGHEDAEKLRELAKANGTLITPQGETNRMRHQIEQRDPGWRTRILEPSIRSFKTGLIVAHHQDERYFPQTIRPGQEFQNLTRAIQRTSEQGRPDVPIAVSLHHTYQDNAEINKIEREFSEHKIDEAEAHKRLEAMGEDPDEYRFVGGSGGLVTPYEDDPEAITPEEHTQMKNNLRDQWINGKMDVDKYRQKAAEVPLPTKPGGGVRKAEPAAEKQPSTIETPPATPEQDDEPAEAPSEPPAAPSGPPPKPKPQKATPPAPDEPLPEPEAEEQPAPGKVKKTKAEEDEEKEIKAEAMRTAAIDRDKIETPEDKKEQAASIRLNKVSKAWVKQNPDVHPQSMHAHLTGARSFPGKLKNEQIGEYYDANNPKLDYENEEHREHASDAVVHDVMHSLAGTTTGGKPSHAFGWYSRTIRKALKKAGEIAPKIATDKDHDLAFKLAWAITSQGQDVFPNTESTWAAYHHFVKTGRLPESREIFGGGLKAEQMEENFAKINKLWHGDKDKPGLGSDKLRKMLMKRMTVGELAKAYPGLDVGGELAHHTVNGAMMMGAKIGAFFSNLNGDYEPTTMDLWFSRNMNLMAGNMFKFSDEATRKDRIEKGEVVKSHLSQLRDAVNSGMLSIDEQQAKTISKELDALMAVPEGKLDRPTARALAPEIYKWARERHRLYQQSPGVEGSYDESFKTPENLTAKKLDESTSKLSDAPRNGRERELWRDIMRRAGEKLKAAGVHLTNADKQALLWFNIKDLFKLGGSPQRPKADYLDAMHALVHKVKLGKLPSLPVEEMQEAA